MDIPGQNIEKAAAEVGTEAGKSIVKGLTRIGGAVLAEWIGTKEAKAEAARLAIETQTQIKKDKQLQAHRRQSEIEELEHKALLQRRFERLRVELAREQANLEGIATQAIEYTSQHAESEAARDIDVDWMFAFAEYAERASDKELQRLWAKILASAATSGRPRLSAAALQTVSLLDKETAIDFEKFCAVVSSFGYYPAHDHAGTIDLEVQNIDLMRLKELGLIQDQMTTKPYVFPGFHLFITTNYKQAGLFHTNFSLTRRGCEIANTVLDRTTVTLSDEVRRDYMQSVISIQTEAYHGITLVPLPKEPGGFPPFRIKITHPTEKGPTKPDLSVLKDQIGAELRDLLAWASTQYDVAVQNNIP